MRILLIRHGDPDYVNDTLTEKGRREAALLAKRAVSMNMGECYKSPLGRAKDTAAPCLEVTGKTAEILDWLQEFPAQVDLNKNPELEKAYPDVKKEGGYFLPRIAWDMVPGYWTEHEAYMDKNTWRETEVAKNSDLVEVYDHVTQGIIWMSTPIHELGLIGSPLSKLSEGFPGACIELMLILKYWFL